MNGLIVNELAHLAKQEHRRAALEREAMRAAAADLSRQDGNGGRGLRVPPAIARAVRASTRWMAWPASDSSVTSPVLHAGTRREAC